MKGDFSRETFQRDKHYSSVRLQQGRVPLDADWNEQAEIEADLRRTAIGDIIGGCCVPAGAPDSYRVSFVQNALQVDGGRMWVRGYLCENLAPQSVPLPEAPGRYIAYLEVFERHVTAIEDPDIREIALGGPDTATRTQVVARPRIAPADAGSTCASLKGFVPPGETTGQMTASTGAQPPETPCVVPAAAGYARLENQLYRIEIQKGGTIGSGQEPTFKWSRDNGSITAEWLRVDGNELVIPDAGRDDLLGFQDCRWVELGDDATDLRGDVGILVEVLGRRTDADGHFRFQFDGHGQALPDPATLGHPKVRRWDHDADSEFGMAITANSPIAIEGGIQVQFSPGAYRPGDYWLIPARTFAGLTIGDILWPRDGSGNSLPQPPRGVKRFYCRLALFDVTAGRGPRVVEDCRNVFPSLCGLKLKNGCCTVTVGVGGDVATIAEALKRLPAEGGEVCILPGTYRERIVLTGRADIGIHGCHGRVSIVESDDKPVIEISNCQRIEIRSLLITAPATVGVSVDRSSEVRLQGLAIQSRDRAAIHGTKLQRFTLLDSSVLLRPGKREQDNSSSETAVFVAGTEILVERNHIGAENERADIMPAGGLQIGGGSSKVQVRRNVIEDGSGAGIVLGSVSSPRRDLNIHAIFDTLLARTPGSAKDLANDPGLNATTEHFANLRPAPSRINLDVSLLGGGKVVRPEPVARLVSDGNLTALLIRENTILNMGSSGITVAHFFDITEKQADFISTSQLEIASNRVEGCLRLPHSDVPRTLVDDSAIGGIALTDAAELVIRDNEILGNGVAIQNAVCGVFVLFGRGVEIHRNRIRHNGAPPVREAAPPVEQHGGIVIGMAQVPLRDLSFTPGAAPIRRQDGSPALRVHDNVVVAPAGRALEVIALGPVTVQGNQFTSLGAETRTRSANSPLGLQVPPGAPYGILLNALSGVVVLLLNLGVSNEQGLQPSGFAHLGLHSNLVQGTADRLVDTPVLAEGNIQFNDNQIVLDALDLLNTAVMSAATFLSLDDISVEGNQSDCDLLKDIVVTNLLAYGYSLRAVGNRFKEGIPYGFFSGVTIGFLNTTALNQGTHCFVRVSPVIPSNHENTMLVQRLAGGDNACNTAAALEKQLRGSIFGV